MFLSALELRDRAVLALGRPDVGVATSIPIIAGREKCSAAVFLYKVALNPRHSVMFPPHLLVLLDPETGAIRAARRFQSSELGIEVDQEKPLPRHPDERRHPNPDLFWQHFDRLMAVFHEAYWAYARGVVRFAPADRAKMVECAELFAEVAEKRVTAWYEGLGGPFLSWLRGFRERS